VIRTPSDRLSNKLTVSRKPGIMEGHKLTGDGGIIDNALMPLNTQDKFRKRYAHCHKQFILDSPHWTVAAVIVVDHGTLIVRGIAKEPLDPFRRFIHDSDAYLEMGLYDLLAFAMKRLTLAGILWRWFTHRIKVKRPLRLLKLYRIYSLLDA